MLSDSLYKPLILFVAKKYGGSLRIFTVSFSLNSNNGIDSFHFVWIDELFAVLRRLEDFSKFDLYSGYH